MHIGEKMALHLSGGSGNTSSSIHSTTDNDRIFNKEEADKPSQVPNNEVVAQNDSIKDSTSHVDVPPPVPPRYAQPPAEEDANEQKSSNEDLLSEQRSRIKELYNETTEKLQDGDSVYLFPVYWFNNFFQKPIDEISSTTSLKEIFGVPELPKEIDFTNYTQYLSANVFMPLASDVLAEIYKHYGFKGNVIEVFVTFDENGAVIVDPVVLNLQTVLLVENSWQTNQTQPIVFGGSRHSTLARHYQLAANFLEQHLSLENVDKRFWLSISDKKDNKIKSFLLLPQQFLTLSDIEYIDHTMADKKLCDISNDNIVSLIVEVNFTGSWPSLYHLYNSKENSISSSKATTGTLGLNNLGNTCFMNSALQCLVHIPELADYFSYGCYKNELNLDNPLGYDGKIAKAFGELVEELYGRSEGTQATTGKAIAPRNFKMNLGFCNPMFAGYYQQDSQEFLSFLLDGLHEDLNRIKKKPYVENAQYGIDFDYNNADEVTNLAKETWEKYKLRNDSIILDLFVGLFKSTLICPDCKHVSITFDPFNDLSLPIPVETTWKKQLYVLPLNDSPHTLELELRDDSKYQDLKAEVAKYLKTDVENIVGFEFYSSSIYKCFENETSGSIFLPIGDLINQEDIIFFIEIGSFDPEKEILIPVYNSCETPSKRFSNMSNDRLCGYPLLIKFEKDKLGDFAYIISTICTFIGNYTTFDPTFMEEGSKQELNLAFDEKLKELSFEYSLNDDVVVELQKYKDSWVLYKNITNIFGVEYLENKDIADLEEELKSNSDAVKIPAGRLDLSSSFDLCDLSGNLFALLFNESLEKAKTKEDLICNEVSNSQSENENSDSNEPEVNYAPKDVVSDVEMEKIDSSLSEPTKKQLISSDEFILPSVALKNNLTKKDGIFIINWKMNQEDQERFYKTPNSYNNDELEKKKSKMAKTEKKNITLSDCLDLFTRPEILSLQNSWYCPTCKDQKQADKQIQLWELPDILCIHLKRFKNQSSFSDKINELIEFPIENFDLSSYVTKNDSDTKYMYDLIGVDNHYGGIGGGHYTAFAKNFSDSSWYYFNDSRVTKENVEDSVNEAAYLLFYKRKNSTTSNKKVAQLIDEKKAEYERVGKLLDDRQKHVAILLKNHGVSILDESEEETTSSGEEDAGNGVVEKGRTHQENDSEEEIEKI